VDPLVAGLVGAETLDTLETFLGGEEARFGDVVVEEVIADWCGYDREQPAEQIDTGNRQ
jgi:hypothetical protein